jgi:Domain of unknown function (DUF5916)
VIRTLRIVAMLLCVCCCGGTLAAELVDTRVPTVELLRLPRGAPPIRVDGKLDEAIWQSAPVFDHFLVLEPDTLAQPAYPTRVRFVYTDKGIYVGAEMTQPRDTLISRLSSRDAFQVSRDAFSFTLDSSGAGRYGYWFEVGLGDSYSDGTVLPERQYSNEWDGAWRGASHVTATGWSAELFVPWGVVAMPQAGETRHMAFYMSRKVAHLDQRWGYPALPPTQPKFISALQGIDMHDVAPRQQYALFPYVSVTHDQIDGETPYKAGTDIFWRPSSNLQLLATLNPDFGTVESDEIIINFSATETYYPEKRLFFLEGQEIFVATPRANPRNRGVAKPSPPLTMVYTRRIGGPTDEFVVDPGTEVESQELYQLSELQGAAKATGQIGSLRYGVLGAAEDGRSFHTTTDGVPETLHQDGRDFGVVRLLYEDSAGGAYRGLGILSTAVHKPNGDAMAQGLDFHYLTSSAKWKIDGQTFMSDISGEQRGYGGFVDVEYSIRQGVTQRVGIEYLDAHLDLSDLGYMQRNDEMRIRASQTRTASGLGWAHENEFDIRGFLQQNSDDEFNGGGVFIANRTTLNNLDKLTWRTSFVPKQYDDLDSFGNGSYKIGPMGDASVRYDTDSTQVWAFGIGGGWFQEDLQGNSYTLEGQIDWRPSDRFNASLAVVYTDHNGWLLYQQERNFTTFAAKQWEPQLSVEYFIDARQQLRASLQWVGIKAREQDFYLVPEDPGSLIHTPKPPGPSDDFSLSQINFQLRYRWELAPLSDLFVVYTRLAYQVAPLEASDFGSLFNTAYDEPLSNVFVVKLRYRFGS